MVSTVQGRAIVRHITNVLPWAVDRNMEFASWMMILLEDIVLLQKIVNGLSWKNVMIKVNASNDLENKDELNSQLK